MAVSPSSRIIQFAGGTRAQWQAAPTFILLDRQLGVCRNTDGTVELRVGDGIHSFFDLPLASSAGTGSATWSTLSGKPTVVAAGGNAAAARSVISAASTDDLAAKADLVAGVLRVDQLPAAALVVFLGTVASQTAMLALTGQPGEWCLRSDTNSRWDLTGSTPSQLASWTQALTPTPAGIGAVKNAGSAPAIICRTAAEGVPTAAQCAALGYPEGALISVDDV